MLARRGLDLRQAVAVLTFLLIAIRVEGGEQRMPDEAIDAIEAGIRSAFVSYPRDDDPDWRAPCWIMPQECSQLARSILTELKARGFEIAKAKA
jgi:hypothetical protein